MNNMELHALFQAEEEALTRAFKHHGLSENNSDEERLSNVPEILKQVYKLPDEYLCQKLAEHIQSEPIINTALKGILVRALHYCFMTGKKASMRCLLIAGARLDWTPDQVSLALGEVPSMPQTGKADPFCFACQVGNMEAAREYLTLFDTGRGKSSDAVMAAVTARDTDIVRWLMGMGFDPNAVDDNKWEALERAVYNDDIATAEVLLAAGAEPHGSKEKPYTSPVKKVISDDMRRLFVKYGVNPANFEYGPCLESPNLKRLPEIKLTESDFETHRTYQVGNSNPEPFLPSLWSEQMRDSQHFRLKALGYEPDKDKPVWSFSRFGRTATVLKDGRLVLVAGEHEDHYDADFCIYADVTVLGTDGKLEHFIYPKDVFPPTDFHTATLVGDHIWLIGCLGYPEQRDHTQTQVLRLSTLDFSITPVETSGVSPGWIHRHRSVLIEDGILVTGGKIEPGYRDNRSTFSLNLKTLVWQEVSDSGH
ncbi:MAG: ankyrin repeat domain-containing protein [Pseudomonadota bacterium]